MKLLRIKFENLNSLPSGDIDLEQGPLAHAGIFAITGPTGSGKSTILDAVTLALYGRAARYGKAANPEDMMSRHTGHCRAEVTFQVAQGRYHAQWELRRARNRPEGNVQPPSRRLLDHAGRALAQNPTGTDREVERITGLNYDRFLRSALLAQGQFARFLKADEKERADLLESLTSTVIYSHLGELAYREATEREKELERERQRLESLALLSPEAVTEREQCVAACTEAVGQLQKEREGLTARRELGRQLIALRQQGEALSARQHSLLNRRNAAAPELATLEQHRATEPFAEAIAPLAEGTRALAQEKTRLAEAQKAEAAATENLGHATAAAREKIAQALEHAQRTLAADSAALEALSAPLATHRCWLAEHPAQVALQTSLPGLVETITRLRADRHTLTETVAACTRLEQERTASQATRASHLTAQQGATSALADASAGAEAARAAIKTLTQARPVDAVINDAEVLEKKRERLAQLQGLIDQREAIAKEMATLTDEETRLEKELEQARLQHTATESEALAQTRKLDLARTTLEHLERIASYEDQRTRLTEGEPCPLCGAEEHPFATPGQPFSREIEEARRIVGIARAADETARREVQVASRYVTEIQAEQTQLQRRRGQLRLEQMESHEAFETSARPLRLFTAERLKEAIEANTQAIETHKQTLLALREAEATRAQREIALEKARALHTRAADALKSEDEKLQRIQAELASLSERATRLKEALTQAIQHVAPLLSPLGLTPPEGGEEAGLIAALQAQDTTARGHQQALQTLETRQEKLRHATENGQTRLDALRALEEKIRALYNPLAPAFRPEMDRWLQRWNTPQECLASVESLRAEQARAATTATECQKRCDELNQTTAAKRAEVERLLAASPFRTLEHWQAARLPREQAERLETLRQQLEGEHQQLAALGRQNAEAIAALQTQDAPFGDALETISTALAQLEATLHETIARQTKARHELAEDAQRRTQQTKGWQAYEQARAELGTWLALRELIGSADGRRFSRYAQGLSLDLLIRHANGHLHRLNDRYRLRRVTTGELNLEIIDRHQAGVARPVNSLSGGESFLVSLALALGLSDLAGRNVRIESLFIDEGFGSLDAETLDTAIAALDTLRMAEKTIGIISHVEILKERIPVQIQVEKQPGGLGRIRLPSLA